MFDRTIFYVAATALLILMIGDPILWYIMAGGDIEWTIAGLIGNNLPSNVASVGLCLLIIYRKHFTGAPRKH